jgi:pimeloyl-ACP methyl ester carboxylesterase
MSRRTVILVPGYNEPPAHFDVLCKGKGAVPGMQRYGLRCVSFDEHHDTLSDRIKHFARFVDDLKRAGAQPPFVTLGYSLGGLVVRGFLRQFPERSAEVSHTVMIAAPNWGVVTMAMPPLTRLLRVPDRAMADMGLGSEFMQWLNGTNGRWVHVPGHGHRFWLLDREPWIGPPGAKMLTIQGLVPSRGGDNDGLVWADSATLGSRIPAHYVVGPHANHMNIIGHFDPMVMLTKGFLGNDRVWPLTLAAILRFIGAQPGRAVESL